MYWTYSEHATSALSHQSCVISRHWSDVIASLWNSERGSQPSVHGLGLSHWKHQKLNFITFMGYFCNNKLELGAVFASFFLSTSCQAPNNNNMLIFNKSRSSEQEEAVCHRHLSASAAHETWVMLRGLSVFNTFSCMLSFSVSFVI